MSVLCCYFQSPTKHWFLHKSWSAFRHDYYMVNWFQHSRSVKKKSLKSWQHVLIFPCEVIYCSLWQSHCIFVWESQVTFSVIQSQKYLKLIQNLSHIVQCMDPRIFTKASDNLLRRGKSQSSQRLGAYEWQALDMWLQSGGKLLGVINGWYWLCFITFLWCSCQWQAKKCS